MLTHCVVIRRAAAHAFRCLQLTAFVEPRFACGTPVGRNLNFYSGCLPGRRSVRAMRPFRAHPAPSDQQLVPFPPAASMRRHFRRDAVRTRRYGIASHSALRQPRGRVAGKIACEVAVAQRGTTSAAQFRNSNFPCDPDD